MKYAIIFTILLIIFIIFKVKNQVKEVNYLNDILYVQKNPQKYIEEMNKILDKKQTDKNKVINTIQKTTGMMYAGQFNDVIEILHNIQNVPKNWLPIYYQNLLLSSYFKKDKNKANEEMKRAKPIFTEFIKNQYYKEFIDIVNLVADFYNGKYSKHDFYELAENGANDYRKSFGYYFLGLINKKEKSSTEAEKNFKKAIELGQGSFIEKFSME